MRVEGKSTRIHERMKPNLQLNVRYCHGADREWEEDTRVTELTRHGAGFALSRPVEIGRLIHLALPMPQKLRAFDYLSRLYNVWALVRHVSMIRPTTPNKIRVSVGTAFIGKDPLPSFLENPTTRYGLKPTLTKDGFWIARETPRNSGRFARPVELRHAVSATVCLETINEQGELSRPEQAEMVDVSESGAAVLTRLQSECGGFVRLSTNDEPTSMLAVVRGHNVDSRGGSVLHLEFVSGKWPLKV